jgi:membrane associated rhomboid family serine protease
MPLSTRHYAARSYYSQSFPPGVKWLLIANVAIFVAHFLAAQARMSWIFDWAGLVPSHVVHGRIWELVTYMFLHSLGSFWHILVNMLMLYMFGADLERAWGTERFLRYYFLCGIGAGICVVIGNYLFGNPNTYTIGASGAIYGLLLAFGMLYPDRQILFSFLFPIPAKYFVMILGGIAFLSTFGSSGGGVSHVAHLGGMLFGYGYLKSARRGRKGPSFLAGAENWYRDWKINRAKKKFDVYMRRHRDD